jgi:four helix bundle protein
VFDHEKLEVYQLELQFLAWVTILLQEVNQLDHVRIREVCDHLDRASLSSLLNTAEGNGKRQRQVPAKFFDDARGSATEYAACLDALIAKGISSMQRIQGKDLLIRIVSMLTKPVQLYEGEGKVREEDGDYQLEQ